jgi:endonuclease/exonuclease/phosphatase family metal-dependent hydrolase
MSDHDRIRRSGSEAVSVLLALGLLCIPSARAQEQPLELRVMAANTTSQRFQSYPNPGPGTRFFQALQPDVVLIQEFNVNATRNAPNGDDAVDAWVSEVFGPDYHWTREPGGDSIPNGVISRWPIVESGQWTDFEVGNRDFSYARIDLPGETDLWAVSVHFLTRGPGVRATEAQALVDAIRAHPVPEDDFLVIGGDFNTDHRGEPALEVLSELVDTLGPFPEDGTGNGGTNSRRRKPYDWVLADADLESLSTATEVGEFVFANGLVFDSRVFSQDDLEESFFPVAGGDSAAPQMQHMAVVRDFALGPGGSTPTVTVELVGGPVDFGAVDPGPFMDSSVKLTAIDGVLLTSVTFDGTHPAEFALQSPDLDAGPVELTEDLELTFSWAPDTSVAGERRVTATLVIDADPGALEVELGGSVAAPDPEVTTDEDEDENETDRPDALDLGGFRVEQTGGDATLTIPANTVLEPGGLLVIGRGASRAEFEQFWGALDPEVVYLNGIDVAGDPGFPMINGGERFRLVDAAGVTTEALPDTATPNGKAYQRLSTAGTDFEAQDDARNEASPGAFDGETVGDGRLVVTEFSDAPGSGNFVFEFIELFWDSAGPGSE